MLLVIIGATVFSVCADAQFKDKAFTQNYNSPEDTTGNDTTAVMFSLKKFFKGVSHKEPLQIGTMFAGSTVFIGCEQIYNRQYWKLPLIYGGMGATIGLGIHYRKQYNSSLDAYNADFAVNGTNTTFKIDNDSKKISNYLFAGAAAIYWGTLMDGVVNYNKDAYPQPGKATIYSLLLPGLGQAYNGEYWKIPVYWACMAGSYHFLSLNDTNYRRYKRIYNEATSDPENYDGPISSETALYYRNVFRRYRDYSIVALAGFYLLQAIDANVFAYMHDFEVSDNLTMDITPVITMPSSSYAFGPQQGNIGFSVGLKF
ncbi:MAG: DUF5683 domain-containing protein [Bacteroidales bacterium]|nr:DUF5683 domain-containing protein [Bacteroidales bacterium]MCI1786335.1 DUF5683 domain-containing protein [Bacteroidales bacterium]